MYIPPHPARRGAPSWGVVRAERDAAPAGRLRQPALGRPRVPVRPHYEGLPSMAGRGWDEGGRKPAGWGRPLGRSVPARKNGPENRNRGGGVPEGEASASWTSRRKAELEAPSGAPPPRALLGR